MLEELKFQKRIRNMAEGEEGFLLFGAVLKDENGVEWLNTNAFVSKKYRVLSRHIKRVSQSSGLYEISSNDIITANAETAQFAHSSRLINNPGFICLENYLKKTYESEQNTYDDTSTPNRKILAPLYTIFMEPEILNTVLIRTGIPEIINGQKPGFNGVILYGRGGTGKTAFQKAIGQVYKNAGAISEELNVAQMSEKYIGSLSNNLDYKISEIVEKSKKLNCPAFIFLDEASSLVMSSAKHNESGVDYYQEAVDVLKKYISNYPDLVFSITTNIEPDLFDDTLIREGRLHPVHITYPGETEKVSMWKYFLKLFDITDDLSEEEYLNLANAIPNEQGAFITEFCKSYIPLKKLELESTQSGATNLLDVLARGCYVSMENVKSSINYESILNDVTRAVEKKSPCNIKQVGFLN